MVAVFVVGCFLGLVVMELPVFSLPSSFWEDDADARAPKNLAAVVVVVAKGGGGGLVVVRCETGGGFVATGAGAVIDVVELDRSAAWTGGAGMIYRNGSGGDWIS